MQTLIVAAPFDDDNCSRYQGEVVDGSGYPNVALLLKSNYLVWPEGDIKPAECACGRRWLSVENVHARQHFESCKAPAQPTAKAAAKKKTAKKAPAKKKATKKAAKKR